MPKPTGIYRGQYAANELSLGVCYSHNEEAFAGASVTERGFFLPRIVNNFPTSMNISKDFFLIKLKGKDLFFIFIPDGIYSTFSPPPFYSSHIHLPVLSLLSPAYKGSYLKHILPLTRLPTTRIGNAL